MTPTGTESEAMIELDARSLRTLRHVVAVREDGIYPPEATPSALRELASELSILADLHEQLVEGGLAARRASDALWLLTLEIQSRKSCAQDERATAAAMRDGSYGRRFADQNPPSVFASYDWTLQAAQIHEEYAAGCDRELSDLEHTSAFIRAAAGLS